MVQRLVFCISQGCRRCTRCRARTRRYCRPRWIRRACPSPSSARLTSSTGVNSFALQFQTSDYCCDCWHLVAAGHVVSLRSRQAANRSVHPLRCQRVSLLAAAASEAVAAGAAAAASVAAWCLASSHEDPLAGQGTAERRADCTLGPLTQSCWRACAQAAEQLPEQPERDHHHRNAGERPRRRAHQGRQDPLLRGPRQRWAAVCFCVDASLTAGRDAMQQLHLENDVQRTRECLPTCLGV